MQILMGVSTTFCSSGNIVQIINALYLKWNINIVFYHRQISLSVAVVTVKGYFFAFINGCHQTRFLKIE